MRRLSSGKLKVSPEHKQMLEQTTITESGPGSILRDFNILLEFIGERGLPITGTHQLPMRTLPEINARLAHPLEQKLRRPQQKSYPHINGLYLLLRASGLTFTGGANKKPLLWVDRELVQTWHRLNPTEQYFTLLETWLLRGNPEIIGESSSWHLIPNQFTAWMQFFEEIPQTGLKIAENRDLEYLLPYAPGWYNVGLLQLFGLITVRNDLPVEGKAWNIESVSRTAFGDALLALLFSKLFGNIEDIFDLEDRKAPPGVLQPVLQPYFPDWRNNLSMPEWVFREGVHTFKVSLGRVWCRIAIPAAFTLDALATEILSAFEFDNDHLYQFSYKNRFGAPERVRHPYLEEGPWTSEVSVGDLPIGVGHTMIFLFDFGDRWQFDVTLERVDPDTVVEEPVLLELHGKPPEQYPRGDWE